MSTFRRVFVCGRLGSETLELLVQKSWLTRWFTDFWWLKTESMVADTEIRTPFKAPTSPFTVQNV